MLERGDRDGQLVWIRIRRAIAEFADRAQGEAELAGDSRFGCAVQPANQFQMPFVVRPEMLRQASAEGAAYTVTADNHGVSRKIVLWPTR
jgi:hypothetical protein